jgi:hypothetical protein
MAERQRNGDANGRPVPPVSFPPLTAADALVPDEFTVWAMADIHGCLSGALAALNASGLTAGGHWVAPPLTALIVVGDHINRGTDSAGVVAFLSKLQHEATSTGSRVVMVRGNHEQMTADALRGDRAGFARWSRPEVFEGFRQSYLPDLSPFAVGRQETVIEAVNALAPTLLSWLLGTFSYARWRDVLFVHAGLPIPSVLADLSTYDFHLYDAGPFLSSRGLYAPAYRSYREAGITRVVVGHLPVDRVTTGAGGDALRIDTDASGLRRADRTSKLSNCSVVRLPTDGPIDRGYVVSVSTEGAPDRQPRGR